MKEKTKNTILEVGKELILNKGYNNVGLNEILKKAQVPKGSFYYYFKSKEDFGIQVIEHYSNSSLEILRSHLLNKNLSPKIRILNFFTEMRSTYASLKWTQGCLIGNCSLELGDLKESFANTLSKELNAWQLIFEHCIKEGQDSGEINTHFSEKELANFMLNAWEGSLLRMKADKSGQPIQVFIKLIEKLLE